MTKRFYIYLWNPAEKNWSVGYQVAKWCFTPVKDFDTELKAARFANEHNKAKQ